MQDLVAVGRLEHRPQERLGDASHHGGRLERPPGVFVLDVLQVEPRELLHHTGQRRLLEAELGPLDDARRGEHERQRMPSRDPVEARRIGGIHAEALQQRPRVGVLERAKREAAEAVEREPSRHGPLWPATTRLT